jgi:hypothetical protein
VRCGEGDGPKTILLVDGIPSAEAAHARFGRLRDELLQLLLIWIVAAHDDDRSRGRRSS